MDLNQISYFLELCKHEHMSVAAELLNISQPALSRNISALEGELGVQLFERVGKRIKLNRNGIEFARYAEQAIQALDQGRRAAKMLPYEVTGRITILSFVHGPILGECLSAYVHLNPYTQVMVSQFGLGERLKRNDTPDFILCSSHGTWSSNPEQFWIEEPLMQSDYVLVVPNQLYSPPSTNQTQLALADVKDLPFITMTNRSIFFQDSTFLLCQNAGFFPKNTFLTDSHEMRLEMLRQGMGIAILPQSYVPYLDHAPAELSVYTLEDCSIRHTLSVLRQKKNQMSEAALDFWTFMLDFFDRPKDERA